VVDWVTVADEDSEWKLKNDDFATNEQADADDKERDEGLIKVMMK
jgi:hypothetical protein